MSALQALAAVWTGSAFVVIGACVGGVVQERRERRQQERHGAALVAEIEQRNAAAADVLAEAESIVRTFASSIGVR